MSMKEQLKLYDIIDKKRDDVVKFRREILTRIEKDVVKGQLTRNEADEVISELELYFPRKDRIK